MAKILIASNEEVEKELGHTKEQVLKNFAKVSLDRQLKGGKQNANS